MRIVIVGPGALGSLLAVALANTGLQIFLLDHDAPRAALLAARGISVQENSHEVHCRPRVTTEAAAIGPAEMVLLCVKSYAVAAALERAYPLFSQHTVLVAFQNGLQHLSQIPAAGLPGCWAAGVTSQGATMLGPGKVRHGGTGETHLGFPGPAGERAHQALQELASSLSHGGIQTRVVADIRRFLWAKLLVNAGINALTALYDCPNGGLLEKPERRKRLAAAVLEAAAVARAAKIQLPDDPVERVMQVCRATATNISSMLQDVRRQHPTEIEAINGALLREARHYGVAVPVNAELVRAVKELEKRFLPGDRPE